MMTSLVVLSSLVILAALAQANKVRPGLLSTAVMPGGSEMVQSCSKTKVEIHHVKIDHAWDIEGVRSYAQTAGWDGLVKSGIRINSTIQLGDYPGNWTLELLCHPRLKGIVFTLNYTTTESTPYQIHAKLAVVSDNSSVIARPLYLYRLNRTFLDFTSTSDLLFDHAFKKHESDGSVDTMVYHNSWVSSERELEALSLEAESENDKVSVIVSVDITHAEVKEVSEASSNCGQPSFGKAKELEVVTVPSFLPLLG